MPRAFAEFNRRLDRSALTSPDIPYERQADREVNRNHQPDETGGCPLRGEACEVRA